MPTIQQATVDRHTEPEQRRQFVKIPTDIVRDKTLSRTARLLYAEIRTFAWESIDSECYASQATLADHLGCSVKTVQRAAKELTERGLISCRHTQGTNRYQPERRSQGDAGVVPGATLVSHEAEKKAEEEKQMVVVVVVVVLRAPPRSLPPVLRPPRLLPSPRRSATEFT